ncbi:MAG TPA: hypothetical protein VLJ37_01800 [bacterium]|nr:hypothetical protein [bacterium]
MDSGTLPGRKGPPPDGAPSEKEEEYVLQEAPGDRDREDDELDRLERDIALGNLPEPRPLRRMPRRPFNTEAPTGAAPSGSPAAFASAPAPVPPAGPVASQTGAAGPGVTSSSGSFGTFPALPATAVSPSSSSSASSGRTVTSPAPKTPATGRTEKQVASLPPAPPSSSKDVKGDAVPREGTIVSPPDELIKPAGNTTPEAQKIIVGDEGESAWREAMQIPAGFAGLSLVPKSVAAVPPPASDLAAVSETQPAVTPILGATFNSGFDPSEQPVLEILKDCGDPAQNPNCDPHRLPPGAPFLNDYFYDNKAHQGDLNPDTKDAMEIGIVVIGTDKDASGKEIPQAEAAFHILPGFAPGKYQVSLAGKTVKLVGSFEVVAAAPALETAAMFRGAAPETKPAAKSVPVPK